MGTMLIHPRTDTEEWTVFIESLVGGRYAGRIVFTWAITLNMDQFSTQPGSYSPSLSNFSGIALRSDIGFECSLEATLNCLISLDNFCT